MTIIHFTLKYHMVRFLSLSLSQKSYQILIKVKVSSIKSCQRKSWELERHCSQVEINSRLEFQKLMNFLKFKMRRKNKFRRFNLLMCEIIPSVGAFTHSHSDSLYVRTIDMTSSCMTERAPSSSAPMSQPYGHIFQCLWPVLPLQLAKPIEKRRNNGLWRCAIIKLPKTHSLSLFFFHSSE